MMKYFKISLVTSTVAFIQILMNVNLSLNQSLLTFRLCETETNFDESIDSGNVLLQYKNILLLICTVLLFMWMKDFLLQGIYH